MISKTDVLINNYEKVVREPWTQKLSGQEKVWFLVYDPTEQRKVMFRLGDFERVTRKHQRDWLHVSLADAFPVWMAEHEYREEYFQSPAEIQDQIETGFKDFVVERIKKTLTGAPNLENTVLTITDVNALFGFIKLSDVLNDLYAFNKGRMLIFFPGEHHNNHYRLMDARDGWSYLARPITA